MTCYSPTRAWQPEGGGPLVFSERKDHRELKISCGWCIGCRIEKQEGWAIRCYAESLTTDPNWFITLTYDDEHYPLHGSLNLRHMQLFNKQVRKKHGPFRFFMAGEYGDKTQRPHYHMLAFGLNIDDLCKCNSVYAKQDVYTSESLRQLWGRGNVSVGTVTMASARYCTSYIMKKWQGDGAEEHYERLDPATGEIISVTPEFCTMSRRPGIGAKFLQKYWREIYDVHDCVMIGRKRVKIPKFFDRIMKETHGLEHETSQARRIEQIRYEDQTPDRLEVRRVCTEMRKQFFKEHQSNAI